jgi:hypothetical protein
VGIEDRPSWKMEPEGDNWRFDPVPIRAEQERRAHASFESKKLSNALQVEFIEGQVYLDAFLSISSPSDAVKFLNRYDDPHIKRYLEPLKVDQPLMYSDIIWFQEILRRAATTPISEWSQLQPSPHPHLCIHTRHFDQLPPLKCSVQVEYKDGAVGANFISPDGYENWFAVLFFEKASGAEFRLCERVGCHKLFRVESQQGKKYCSTDCAHVSAMRAWRERKKAPKKTTKKTTTKSAKGQPNSRTGKKGRA